MPDPKVLFYCLLIGSVGGVVGGLCGVGGGIIMVPAFVAILGLDQQHAVGTSMAVIAPTALMAILRFKQDSLIRWDLIIPTAIGAALVAYFAAGYVKSLSNQTLTRIFAVLMIVVGAYKLYDSSK
ncbi:MAG: sulfite exporter TauE/SafE family protein [Verrucomicrobiales bacterium]|nr:sulfite exporter TauE/SafE family protein [Verrucomicrobiae bacterium]MCP5552463.1 sulfite exporter TauE/SafE family protein [Akkermansiaceae bacterium]HRX54419.1 sulfite exporter TauE/SafE family protein [Verrucomicrobiales bacterium]